jgi:hypothetical protein
MRRGWGAGLVARVDAALRAVAAIPSRAGDGSARRVHLSSSTSDQYGTPTRLALVNGLNPEGSEDFYNDIAERLRARRIDVEMIQGLAGRISSFGNYGLLISNFPVPASMRAAIPSYCGRFVPRPVSLCLLKALGVPTMEWTLARTRREVRALFSTWDSERVLLKPSFSFGGQGVRVFTREAVWRLRWKHDLDVLCREVNPDDGDVYKAELFNGRILICWKSASPPIRTLFRRGIHRGLLGAYGERSLCELPSHLTEKLEALSRGLTAGGVGHLSVDLMRRPDGELVAIELNTLGVATWWTRQFPHFRDRYTDAIYELAKRHLSPRSDVQT